MGSMIYEEYMTNFMELLRYVTLLKDEKRKFQRFINVFPLAFKYHIEHDEHQSLEEAIGKVKHFYEK